MGLKEQAKARAKKRTAAQAEDDGISSEDHMVPPEEYKPTPNIISGQAYDQPPPLPPAMMYLRLLATIPAFRKKNTGGAGGA